ncbi:hypothetical protein [Ottowia beijingensis]|uniref:hypothetical protein n=1 Tax=Ottowia beijingensis TaxID=1207057 RepID=UPI00214DEEA7|nr:hypothetical protein [Ottowia beijingensis]
MRHEAVSVVCREERAAPAGAGFVVRTDHRRSRIRGLLDIVAHPNAERYPRQRIMVVVIDDYAYLVPYVEEEDHLFLKTIIPSRKATRDFIAAKGE